MNPHAMDPFGEALAAHFGGCKDVHLLVRRDDGVEAPLPVKVFFRNESEFTPLETSALALCKGHVLDVGAGAGLHSLALQRNDVVVTAIDINLDAAEIMRKRGVKDVRCGDIFALQGLRFDTLLMLGHGIGMVETIDGLKHFLKHARSLLPAGGQLLLDSLDVRITNDPGNLAYHDRNRRAGRYIGEVGMQFEFQGDRGPFCGWLQVDPETLAGVAGRTGWECEVVLRESQGDYLARLVPSLPTT